MVNKGEIILTKEHLPNKNLPKLLRGFNLNPLEPVNDVKQFIGEAQHFHSLDVAQHARRDAQPGLYLFDPPLLGSLSQCG